jgi:uncharacterized membrane protein (DUF373 family)
MGTAEGAAQNRWTRFINAFERVIVYVLMCLLMVVVSITTGELAWMLLKDLSWARGLLLDTEELFGLFGFFLLVLIGVELLLTLKTYITESVVHVEVVLEVALIAVAQKIIILDASRTGPLTLLAMSGLVLTLAAAFWWVRVARIRDAAAAAAATATA